MLTINCAKALVRDAKQLSLNSIRDLDGIEAAIRIRRGILRNRPIELYEEDAKILWRILQQARRERVDANNRISVGRMIMRTEEFWNHLQWLDDVDIPDDLRELFYDELAIGEFYEMEAE